MTEIYRIGVIGTGKIAGALVEGIAGDGHVIAVSERNAKVAGRLSRQFSNVTVADNQSVLDQSDVIFLCLTADVAQAVLPTLAFCPDHAVFSLMVGPTLAALGDMIAPARAEAMVIPFPSIAAGGSPVLVHPASDIAASILERRNTVFPVASWEDLDTLLAAQAVLSPALKLVSDAAAWASARTGDPTQAEGFLRLLVGGSLTAAPSDQAGALDGMLEALSTPGGLNATLRDHMDASGMPQSVRAGLDQLEARLKGGT